MDVEQMSMVCLFGILCEELGKGIYKIILDKKFNVNVEYFKGFFQWYIDGIYDDILLFVIMFIGLILLEIGGQIEFVNFYVVYE